MSALLVDPYDPPGIVRYPFRGRPGEELFIAELTEGWHATYRILPRGMPPIMDPTVWVKSLERLPER